MPLVANGDYKNRWQCKEMCFLKLARLEGSRSRGLKREAIKAFGMMMAMITLLLHGLPFLIGEPWEVDSLASTFSWGHLGSFLVQNFQLPSQPPSGSRWTWAWCWPIHTYFLQPTDDASQDFWSLWFSNVLDLKWGRLRFGSIFRLHKYTSTVGKNGAEVQNGH